MKKVLALILAVLFVAFAASCGFSSSSSLIFSGNSSQVPNSSGTSSPNNSSNGPSNTTSDLGNTSVETPENTSNSSDETLSQEGDSSVDTSSNDESSSNNFSDDSTTPSTSVPTNQELPSTPPTSSENNSQEDVFTPVLMENKWCYNNITDVQKQIYEKLYNLVITHSSEFVEIENCVYNDLVIADYALRRDNPQIFWMSGSFYTTYNKTTGKYCIGYNNGSDSGYICSIEEEAILSQTLKIEVENFVKTVNTKMSEYEIVLAAHDYIANKVTYDDQAANDYDSNPYSYTSYGALVAGKAVCEGYAKAFQLLMDVVGMKSMCVTGVYDGVGHMWNMVNIGGDWYNIDVTFDDQTQIYHLFTNRTDEFFQNNKYIFDTEFSESIPDGEGFNIARPKATANIMNYYQVSGYLIDTDMPIDNGFYDAVDLAIKNGRTSLEITLGNNVDAEKFDLDEYIYSAGINFPDIESYKVSKYSGKSVVYILSWNKKKEPIQN